MANRTATRTRTRAPRKDAPAPAPAKATAPAASFDYGSLTVADEGKLPSSGKRGTDVANTPFPAAIDASWAARESKTVKVKGESQTREYGAVKSITVPEAVADKTTRLIRRAADHLDGVGVRIVVGKPENGNVRIAFRAQTARAGKDE